MTPRHLTSTSHTNPIHNPNAHSYDRIDDRKRFIAAYQSSKRELQAILRQRGSRRASECAIM